MAIDFVEVPWGDRAVHIEHEWINRYLSDSPLLIFLHEGLGSLAMWKDFPARLCAALGCRGLVYSRPGYGRSTPRAPQEQWDTDFLHQQAHQVLPALLQVLGVDSAAGKPWLLGHSDGGSIALLYAARYPQNIAAAIVLAPHIFVEDVAISNIERARDAYAEDDLRSRLARFHDDPDSAFWGWNRIWLDPRFKRWSIADEIAAITCPLLAVQGLDDEYGTLEQIHGIARRVPQTQLLELARCGHSPQRDQADALIAAAGAFFRSNCP